MEGNADMGIGRSSTAGHGTSAIHAEGLVRKFGDNVAVDGVDLTVARGEIFGFLGPNGAGKTTTIRMLATLLRPDFGEARIFGHDIVREANAVRGRVSLTGQFASVDEDLTGRENLILIARLLGHARPHVRHGNDGPDRPDTGRMRRTHRRLRPDHDVSVSEQGMKETRRTHREERMIPAKSYVENRRNQPLRVLAEAISPAEKA